MISSFQYKSYDLLSAEAKELFRIKVARTIYMRVGYVFDLRFFFLEGIKTFEMSAYI